MAAYLNGNLLNWCIINNINSPSTITQHVIEDKSKSNVASHVENGFESLSISCKLEGEDRDRRYDNIKNIRNTKEIATLIYVKNFRNLVITNIEESIKTELVIELVISFTIVEFATVETTAEPLPDFKQTVNTNVESGKQGTLENNLILSSGKRLEAI